VSSLGTPPSTRGAVRSVLATIEPVHPGPDQKEKPVNSVALVGRLVSDPTTHAGDKHESAHFRLAVSRTVGEDADFVDVVTFDKLAATCGQWLTKGRQVAVVGKLRLDEWTGRAGERRSRIRVVADAVDFLDRPTKPVADRPAEPEELRQAS
jgi:single-strand DNA-binding protein